MNKTVVITGASRGIGKELAEVFLNQNYSVIGISRTKPNIQLTDWFKADLTNQNDREIIFHEISTKYHHIDVLVNNAGIGLYDTWENSKIEDIKLLFELNFFSMVHLTQLFIPLLEKTKGHIINTSSLAGKIYVPCMGAYCASKYAVNAFSDSLRVELKRRDIKVLNLIVGRISTGFSKYSMGKKKAPSTPGSANPKKLANKIYKAYLKNKTEIVYPWWYHFIIIITKIFTTIYEKINIKKWDL